MTLRHLKVFLTVADLGSMTKAAEILYISQPTVSQTIRELEKHYGIMLFDRIGNKLYLTEKGIKLVGYARHIISLSEEMEKEIKIIDNGEIKIGASVTIGSTILQNIINDFQKLYPLINIRVMINNTHDIENLILENLIDFGIVEGTINSSDIITKSFTNDELIFVCGKNHSLYNKENFTIYDLSNQKFLLREKGSGTRALFENRMAHEGIIWNLTWESSDIIAIKNACINSQGIAVLSRLLVLEEINNGLLKEIKINDIDLLRQFKVIYHKNKYLSEPALEFIKICLYNKK